METAERWYPTYSYYRVTQPDVIVFIHGYGGSEETFAFVPYLVAEFPGRTIMYFNYNTGALKGDLDSFSVIGSDLRAFLHNNIFSRDPNQEVDVICHSTGCPVVRQYIVDNPFDHRIAKLITVAGANYGAYYSETTSRLKEFLPWADGDKQIQELKYGSLTLFYLQQRWHHLFLKTLVREEEDRPKEKWLQKTPFKEFVDVVSPEVDSVRAERVAGQETIENVTVRPQQLALPDSLRRRLQIIKDRDRESRYAVKLKGVMRRAERNVLRALFEKPGDQGAVERLFRRSRAVKLPEIAAVVATDGWRAQWSRKFSDGVVRVESALPDCRFLMKTSLSHPMVFNDECKDRLVVFLPCFHTELFSDKKCRRVVRDLVEYFLIEPKGEMTAEERTQKFQRAYKEIVNQTGLTHYLENLDVAALWVRIRHDGLEESSVKKPDVEEGLAHYWKNRLDRITVDVKAPRRPPRWAIGLYESDFAAAKRSSRSDPERIYYYKYLAAEAMGTDVKIHISFDCKSGGPCTAARIERLDSGSAGPTDYYSLRLFPGKTSMLDCKSKGQVLTDLFCMEITSNNDVPADKIWKEP